MNVFSKKKSKLIFEHFAVNYFVQYFYSYQCYIYLTSLIKEYPGLVTFHDVFGTNNLFISRGSGLYIKNYKYFKRKNFDFSKARPILGLDNSRFLEFLSEIGFGVFCT